ncbi:MAG: patatin-like phospholipase family protein [Planctomycetes bacterium]|nr:patatin-like phospholipase family protein [Planctomycetota bacterium]
MFLLPLGLSGALVATALPAQQTQPRPRVGLVLSGGGARGLAHIGVLEVLEELRVPVDCIAGTSMGSIVGGLYAYGLAPEEIERWVLSVDWPYILQDFPRRADLTIRRKQEEYDFLVQARVGVRDGKIALPKGLIQGQNLGLVLDQLALEAHDLASFDDLPIPFRCVSTNIADGSRVMFDRGDLPLAMRSSMSLPGIFAPVEWGDRLLVDGFLVDNLPVDAARAMGAARLIAVDIGTPPLKREEINDLFGITSQMFSILLERPVREAVESLGPQDLLIRPDLGHLSTSDFVRAAELIAIGKAYARSRAEELSRYSVSPEEYERWRSRQRRPAKPLPVLAEIRIETTSAVSRAAVASHLRTKVGEPLDLLRLQKDLERVYGSDLFEKVRFRLLRQPDGSHILEIKADEKSWGPGYLRFGFDTSTDFDGAGALTLGLNYTHALIGETDAEWRTAVRLGTNTSFASEWFQPLESSRRLFVAPAIGYERFPVRADIGGVQTDAIVQRGGGRLDAGAHLGGWSELRFGIDFQAGDLDFDDVHPSIEGDFDDNGLHASLEIDTLNASIFPTSGVRALAKWKRRFESLGADEDFEVVDVGGYAVATVAGQSVGLLSSLQFETGGETQVPEAFAVGGLFRLTGLGGTARAGPEGGVASLITYRKMGGVYLGGSFEAGGVWDGWDTTNSHSIIFAGSAFAGLATPIGPVYLGYGLAENGEKAAFLIIGQIF